MKIENVKTLIKLNENDEEGLRYSALITLMFNTKPTEGYTARKMKDLIDLMTVLDGASDKEEFELTEEQLKEVKETLSTYKWPFVHKDIVALMEYLETVA